MVSWELRWRSWAWGSGSARETKRVETGLNTFSWIGLPPALAINPRAPRRSREVRGFPGPSLFSSLSSPGAGGEGQGGRKRGAGSLGPPQTTSPEAHGPRAFGRGGGVRGDRAARGVPAVRGRTAWPATGVPRGATGRARAGVPSPAPAWPRRREGQPRGGDPAPCGHRGRAAPAVPAPAGWRLRSAAPSAPPPRPAPAGARRADLPPGREPAAAVLLGGGASLARRPRSWRRSPPARPSSLLPLPSRASAPVLPPRGDFSGKFLFSALVLGESSSRLRSRKLFPPLLPALGCPDPRPAARPAER